MGYRIEVERYWDAFLKFFGLRPYETRAYTIDPYNIYLDQDDPNDRRALRVAVFIAIIFHVFLVLVRFASESGVFLESRQVITLRNIAAPPLAGGGATPKTEPKRVELPKPKPQPLPFPDPTPDEPEPIYEIIPESLPVIIGQISMDLSIGEILAPPGPGGLGASGTGRGGTSGGGAGEGVYEVGGGVRAPVPVSQPLPQYTESARKARVEGLVLLQAIVRKDGSVDSFRVIRGLGYGLDESAISTIANKWRFRPGTLNGQPVDVQCHIEVSFRLY